MNNFKRADWVAKEAFYKLYLYIVGSTRVALVVLSQV